MYIVTAYGFSSFFYLVLILFVEPFFNIGKTMLLKTSIEVKLVN